LLVVTEGNVTDYDQVEAEVGQLCRQYAVREVAYDQRFASQLALHLQGQEVTMINQPPRYQLNEALRKFLELVQSGKLCHGGDGILSWMASNAVVRHGQQGGIRLDKEKASEKIDGMSSLAMALSWLIMAPVEEAVSAYADHRFSRCSLRWPSTRRLLHRSRGRPAVSPGPANASALDRERRSQPDARRANQSDPS